MPDGTTNSGTDNGQQTGGQQQTQGGQQSGQQTQGQQNGAQTPTWDSDLAALSPEARARYDAHVQGLRNTVQATRGERDGLQQKLADLTKALGKDTPEEARRLLGEMQSELETTSRRAAFYEEAGKPEIGCTNPRAAFLVAQSEQLFDRRGNPDWAAIRQAAPELFQTTQRLPAGNAGSGTGQQPPSGNVNDWIRRQAGRR